MRHDAHRCRDLDAWHREVLRAADLSIRRGDGRALVSTSTVKLVGFALRAYMDGPARDAGANARPGHDRLAQELGITEGSVRHACRALVEHGYLIQTARGHTGQAATYAAALPTKSRCPDTASQETRAGVQTPPASESRCLDNTRAGVQTPPTSAVTSAEEQPLMSDLADASPDPKHLDVPSPTQLARAKAERIREDNPDALRLVSLFRAGLTANGVTVPTLGTKAAAEWAIDMDLLLRLGPPGGESPQDPDEVERVITFVLADDFEAANVHSVAKLRKRWDNLRMKARRPHRTARFNDDRSFSHLDPNDPKAWDPDAPAVAREDGTHQEVT
jgi:hypothetical protein